MARTATGGPGGRYGSDISLGNGGTANPLEVLRAEGRRQHERREARNDLERVPALQCRSEYGTGDAFDSRVHAPKSGDQGAFEDVVLCSMALCIRREDGVLKVSPQDALVRQIMLKNGPNSRFRRRLHAQECGDIGIGKDVPSAGLRIVEDWRLLTENRKVSKRVIGVRLLPGLGK